jgi:hypothetical protein
MRKQPVSFRTNPPPLKQQQRYRRALKRLGEAMYGDYWQSALGREVGVNLRTPRRWIKGETVIQPDLWPTVIQIGSARAEELLSALADAKEIGRELGVL